jgi:uncharacterized protein YllA (UPF0747 family)
MESGESEGKIFGKDLLKELNEHPERFSPNVILRGLYQETVLPKSCFYWRGGETAYWLQLKDLFNHYKVPFPMLVLRNSFLIVEKKWQERISKLGFTIEDFFLSSEELLNKVVMNESKNEVKLNGSLSELEQMYENFKKQASAVDSSLEKHVEALKLRTVHRCKNLKRKCSGRRKENSLTNKDRSIPLKNIYFLRMACRNDMIISAITMQNGGESLFIYYISSH